ncbi:hypothetical protein C8J57DRAFT_1212280 [Mycena rebaudengoi]|nr:hypothetical protein C8J57DRAFT_1212280 [Mycena rebaudengoi]
MRKSDSLIRGGGKSKKVNIVGSSRRPGTGGSQGGVQQQRLSRKGQDQYRQRAAEELSGGLHNMDQGNLEEFAELRSLPEECGEDVNSQDQDFFEIRSFLDGSTQVPISHAGGEFEELQAGIEAEMASKKKCAEDHRTRNDCTDRLVDGWASQMDNMVDGYMEWCTEQELGAQPSKSTAVEPELMDILVVEQFVTLDASGRGIATALIKQGLVPCAPFVPSVVIGTKVLEALDRGSPTWRLRHACPACMYKLEGEAALIFSLLATMDGNDSLKRILSREKATETEAGEPVMGKSSERSDKRDGGEDYYLSREKVDSWAKERLAELLPTDEVPGEDNPCAERWKNMINDVVSKMWGIFDETGIFLALCRHGFVLVMADMIRSGELAKYPLAVVEILLKVFGLNIGMGYDIGCHFGATVNKSALGPEARASNFKMLAGSFHGHAHNRLCQLKFLANYVAGLGLEDLEGCERYFSRLNGLARSVRYSSRFHRKQEITTYMKHIDSFETYANLSKFICSNYQQALAILKTELAIKRWMEQEGLDGCECFHEWLNEEREYLQGVGEFSSRAVEETLEMEYIQKLVNLSTSESKLATIRAESRRAESDSAPYNPTPASQVQRRHAIERRDRDLEAVEELEFKLEINTRWTSATPEWAEVVKQIKRRKYQLALDELEKLIVARIFELTKMNQSETGYQMRKHIVKALQVRSKSVKSALETYNTAASLIDPPMRQLSWDNVVEYAFLADFDILRDTNTDVQSKPWTRPAYRLTMDKYFRLLWAKEEIQRLNIEIRRHVTWIEDEDLYLRNKEREYMESDVGLSIQISRYWALARKPGFTGTLVPGVSVEKKEAAEKHREMERAQRDRWRESRRWVEKEEEEEDPMEVEEVEVVTISRQAWAPPGEEDPEWEDADGWDEGEDAAEAAAASMLEQLSMLSIDKTRSGMEEVAMDEGGTVSGDEREGRDDGRDDGGQQVRGAQEAMLMAGQWVGGWDSDRDRRGAEKENSGVRDVMSRIRKHSEKIWVFYP